MRARMDDDDEVVSCSSDSGDEYSGEDDLEQRKSQNVDALLRYAQMQCTLLL